MPSTTIPSPLADRRGEGNTRGRVRAEPSLQQGPVARLAPRVRWADEQTDTHTDTRRQPAKVTVPSCKL